MVKPLNKKQIETSTTLIGKDTVEMLLQVHKDALWILENLGVGCKQPEIQEAFKKYESEGIAVLYKDRIFVTSELVKQCLNNVPGLNEFFVPLNSFFIGGTAPYIYDDKAKKGGVLRRAGHTEATIDFARLAGFYPAGVLVEIMKEDGTMARLPDLKKLAAEFQLKLVSIKDLIAYRIEKETLIEKETEVEMPTEYGKFRLSAYKQIHTGEVHMALVKGQWDKDEPILVRVHSSCATGDIFGSCRCDCGAQLHEAMRMVEKAGKGIVLYMNQEGRGIGLVNKIKAYALQDTGLDTVEANRQLGFKPDMRNYGIGAQILVNLGVRKMRLITNNPKKMVGLEGYGLSVVEQVPIEIQPNEHNRCYLECKKIRMGHLLNIEATS